jgi:heavy metal translocating P-type ATPase
VDNIAKIIEKRTGFSCARVVHAGEELDLIVTCNANLGSNWPDGVTNLTAFASDKVRVSYQPRVIGARNLLSDRFFRSATLAPPSPPPLVASGRTHLRNEFLMTLLSAVLTIPVLALAYSPLPEHTVRYGGVSLGLATLVQTIVGGPFYPRAFKSLLFSRLVEMDMLVVLSTTTAYIYSVVAYSYLVAGNPLSTPEFFETSTLLMTLIMVGRVVSAYARQKAVESISIETLQVSNATLFDPATKEARNIDARLLQYGDIFKVHPEMSIVTDGVVIEGESEVDEAHITGEATLIAKKPGSSVIAGSRNHSGGLLVQLTRLPCENTIKTISIMVDEAKSSKPKVQEIADRVAGYFIPIILVITIIVFAIWVAVGKAVRHQRATTACITAMTYAISVLIVSCPCAIGLAVPMVVVIAGGVGAKHGLIMKSAETIESGHKISHVIFDKTGTLTQGKLSVVAEECINETSDTTVPVILGLTSNSKHPVSAAVATYLKDKNSNVEPAHLESIVSIPGCGIEVTSHANSIRAGNPFWLGVEDYPAVHQLLQRGLTIFCITVNGQLVAVFGLQDSLRLDAHATINELKQRSITVSLISGDNEASVDKTASELGIPSENVRSRCTPADKAEYVKSRSSLSTSNKKNTVLFVGDGTNDAVALAQASIGMHINEGTDIAGAAADAVLIRPSLKGILTLIDLSKAFHRRVVFNFAWSFLYNMFAVLLAAGAFPNARIPPSYAGLGELVSVVPVIGIALALRFVRF